MLQLTIQGKFRDTLVYKSRVTGEQKIEYRDWQKNQIQDSAVNLIVPQLFGMYNNNILTGFLPVNYFALGAGDSAWDNNPVSKPVTQTQLTDETTITTSRIAVNASDFTLLDPSNNNNVPLNPQAPSSKIRLDVTIGLNEGIGTLREFGLFGNATVAKDSGIMFNWITHPKIDKDNQLVINREIILDFSICRS